MMLDDIFRKGIEQHHYANTAYPLDGRKVWKAHRVPAESVDAEVQRQWEGVEELGLYVHIPFCQKRCLYCEYSVLSGEEADLKAEYTDLVLEEIRHYRAILGRRTIVGLDIGGGTPSLLPAESLGRIVNAALEGHNLGEDFGISIETTPAIAQDYLTMKAIRELGIERISMGLQTIDQGLLSHVGRSDNNILTMLLARDSIRRAGFEKYNIDVMYGFASQSQESFAATVQFAIDLAPEYITLYRNRYKGTRLEDEARRVNLEQANQLYDDAFSTLTRSGYVANVGKNTFSRVKGDLGTSAYLTNRVIKGTPYLGMGLGAQSMARGAIYYNEGAATKKLGGYRRKMQEGHFPVQDLYALPPAELMAKVICVSFYFGAIDRKAFQQKFGVSLEEQFPNETQYVVEHGLMENNGDALILTKKGKDVVNGIIPLFYSDVSKANLLARGA